MYLRIITLLVMVVLLTTAFRVEPVEASWYYTCVPHRMHHTHYVREVIHQWKNVIQFHRGGRYYVRGTWASINMNSGNQFASDRRTYDCTGK